MEFLSGLGIGIFIVVVIVGLIVLKFMIGGWNA